MLTLTPSTNGHQQTLPSSVQAINAILESGGNIGLAAERLKIKPDKLAAIVARDASAYDLLATQLRTKLLVDMMNLLNSVQAILFERIPTMSTNEAVRTFSSITNLLASMAEQKQANTPEVIFNMLPPNVAEALRQTINSKSQAQANSNVIPSNPSRHSDSISDKNEYTDDEIV